MAAAGTIQQGATSLTFITLRAMSGGVQVPRQVVEEITRPQVDGQAYRLLGKRGPVFELLGIRDCDDAADAEVKLQAMADLCGGLCTITDDHGQEFQNVLLVDVIRERQSKLLAASGGKSTSKGYLIAVRLVLQLTIPR